MVTIDDPRSAWTTYVPSGRVRVAPATRDGIRWHWAGPYVGLFGKTHASCLSRVKSWEDYHRSKGWNSIGYNLLICVHSRVIEGRGIDYRGAHSGSTDDNAATYGTQFMLGQGEQATDAMFDRATRLERELWEHSGHSLFSAGHRDAPSASTECPGDQIQRWAHQTHTLTTAPSEEDDMPTADEIAKAVHDRPVQVGTSKEPLGLATGRSLAAARRTEAKVDALAAGLAEVLAGIEGVPDDVGAILEQKLKDAVVSVEVNFPVDEPAPPAA